MAEAGYPRDLHGYGRNPPDPKWPGNARVAVQFVVNFEEGGENNVLHGDRASEAFLSDVLGAQPWLGKRHANIESMFEYGSAPPCSGSRGRSHGWESVMPISNRCSNMARAPASGGCGGCLPNANCRPRCLELRRR